MKKPINGNTGDFLFKEIARLIDESRRQVALTVNSALSLLYWKIGTTINAEILKNKRAEYGKQVVQLLAKQLGEKYGSGWDEKTIRHCLRARRLFRRN